MKLNKSVLAALTLSALLLGLAGCEREGPAERAGRELDEAAEKAGEQIEKAGEGMKEEVQDAQN